MNRFDGRAEDALRPLSFHRNYTETPAGSVLVEAGRTKVLCTVSAVPTVPPFQSGKGQGWLTAEYSMLPGSVEGRKPREFARRDGRSVEIQRLIGRSLRAITDLTAFPGWTLTVDCDVLQADGGTRCAAISGSALALHDALRTLSGRGQLNHWAMRDWIAAVSTGYSGGRVLLDLDYGEDFEAAVDMNVVATAGGRIVEVQSTAEEEPFEREIFDRMVGMGLDGVRQITEMQQAAVEGGIPV